MKLLLYLNAFLTGAVVMAFEMLGSRYLNPYFGSGIYTWAALISTVLLSLMLGYFLGGWLADRAPRAPLLGGMIVVAALYLAGVPFVADAALQAIFDAVESVEIGSILAAVALSMLPLTLLGTYSPFAIRLVLTAPGESGRVAGGIYGVSTLGSVVGTLGTTFVLIPAIGTRAITFLLAAAALASGLSFLLPLRVRRAAPAAAMGLLLLLAGLASSAWACQGPPLTPAEIKALPDGRLEEVESEYSRIFIHKGAARVALLFNLTSVDYWQSMIDLSDPDSLAFEYTRLATISVIYPPEPRRMLMLGLGGGSIAEYLLRAMPDLSVTSIEVDPAVLGCARKYFGVRETDRHKVVISDARVYLKRHREPYDLIIADAFRAGYIPFHLLTREFYELLRDRLTPGGAVAFNLHNSNELFPRSLATIQAVFPTVDVYTNGRGSIVIGTQAPRRAESGLQSAAAQAQARWHFRHDLTQVVRAYDAVDPVDLRRHPVLTDDHAPVNTLQSRGRP